MIKKICISIKISLKFFPKGPVDNNPALVQIRAWRRPGDRPLSEPMLVSVLTHIWVVRPQWVKGEPTTDWWIPSQMNSNAESFSAQWRIHILLNPLFFISSPTCASWRLNELAGVSITSLKIVYSTVYSRADQRKHQISASLAFVRGIHRWPVNSPHKWPVTWKMFPFDDVIIFKDFAILVRWDFFFKVFFPSCHQIKPYRMCPGSIADMPCAKHYYHKNSRKLNKKSSTLKCKRQVAIENGPGPTM